MKKLFLSLVFLCATMVVFSQSPNAILGKWFNKDKDAQIQIYKKGNSFYGKIVWLKNPNDGDGKAKSDSKNPDINLQKRSILGLEILKNFNYVDDAYQDGKIYDPKTGKTYSCIIKIEDIDKLSVRGYVGFSFIGRTDIWTRVK